MISKGASDHALYMRLLDRLRNFFEKPIPPSGDPAEFAARRSEAYRVLFEGAPARVLPHDVFEKPPFGGRVDVHIYDLPYRREYGQVQLAVTSGMSDYRMLHRGDGTPRRREIIQYFRECTADHISRLHDAAWLPLAQGFCLDFFETMGSHPRFEHSWPNSLFIPSLVQPHAEFKLDLGGDETQLLWHVPLSEAELEFKTAHGLDALLERMEERELPWVFDEATRIDVV
jgi:hypothetical protein